MPDVRLLSCALALWVLPACHRATTSDPHPVTPQAPVAAAPTPSPRVEPAPAAEPPAAIVGLEHAFEGASAVIAPSVVSITSERPVNGTLPPMLRQFADPDRMMRGLGSGVIIDASGTIVTNNHVVEEAERLRVRLHDDREYDATVVGTDPQTDLAVIQIEAADLVAARLAGDDEIRVGQWVLAAGSPFGLPKTITAGIVSAVGRGDMGIADYGDFIQTDAAVNQGNSGGPLIDLRGRVVGINTAIASRDGGSNGIGFAIPIAMARAITDKLVLHGVVARGWLGVVLGDLSPELTRSFSYSGRHGVLVDDLDPAGPGAVAGLRAGDIIDELDGTPVRDVSMFRNAISTAGPGARVDLGLWRDGRATHVSVELAELPADLRPSATPAGPPKKKATPRLVPLGLTLEEVGAALRRRLDLPAGASGAHVAAVARGSVASSAGLRPGDVVVAIAGTKVKSAAQATQTLAGADLDEGIRIRVHRGPFGRFVMLKRR